MTRFCEFLFVIGLWLLYSMDAIAAAGGSGGKGSLGLMTGMAFPSGSSSALAIGFKGTYQAFPVIRTSAFLIKYGSGLETTIDTNSLIANCSNTFFGVEGTYSLGPDVAAGLKTGLFKVETQVLASSATSTVEFSSDASGLFFGPTLYYDYPMGRFTIGVEGTYLIPLSSNAAKVMLIMAAGKFWF